MRYFFFCFIFTTFTVFNLFAFFFFSFVLSFVIGSPLYHKLSQSFFFLYSIIISWFSNNINLFIFFNVSSLYFSYIFSLFSSLFIIVFLQLLLRYLLKEVNKTVTYILRKNSLILIFSFLILRESSLISKLWHKFLASFSFSQSPDCLFSITFFSFKSVLTLTM